MATPIIMPKFGQMTEESSIVTWHKQEGDPVAKGEILFEVETDKSVMEVESFAEGTLLKIVVQPGVNVPVQSTVGFIGQPGEPVPEVSAPPAPPREPERPATPAATRATPAPTPTPSVPLATPLATAPAAPARFRISPRARVLARQCVIDPSKITGTGPNGRVVEKDVQAYLAAKRYDRLRVTPAAKKLAAQENIDLLAVDAGDDGGRIQVADVRRAVAEQPKPMSRMRQVIAQRLTHSFTTTPHIYVTATVDMTDLIAFRAGLKTQGAPYTITDFISQAVVLGLQEFPQVNSTTDGKTESWRSHVNLGIAVSLENGLVVPVVQHAEELTFAELNRQAVALVGKARQGKLTPDEMSGGTFTISNMGMMDVENFCAIINPGESAILAVSSTVEKPVVRDGKIVPRSIMKMTVSTDHRIVDGALAARFVNAIKQKLEDIELWKLLTS